MKAKFTEFFKSKGQYLLRYVFIAMTVMLMIICFAIPAGNFIKVTEELDLDFGFDEEVDDNVAIKFSGYDVISGKATQIIGKDFTLPNGVNTAYFLMIIIGLAIGIYALLNIGTTHKIPFIVLASAYLLIFCLSCYLCAQSNSIFKANYIDEFEIVKTKMTSATGWAVALSLLVMAINIACCVFIILFAQKHRMPSYLEYARMNKEQIKAKINSNAIYIKSKKYLPISIVCTICILAIFISGMYAISNASNEVAFKKVLSESLYSSDSYQKNEDKITLPFDIESLQKGSINVKSIDMKTSVKIDKYQYHCTFDVVFYRKNTKEEIKTRYTVNFKNSEQGIGGSYYSPAAVSTIAPIPFVYLPFYSMNLLDKDFTIYKMQPSIAYSCIITDVTLI